MRWSSNSRLVLTTAILQLYGCGGDAPDPDTGTAGGSTGNGTGGVIVGAVGGNGSTTGGSSATTTKAPGGGTAETGGAPNTAISSTGGFTSTGATTSAGGSAASKGGTTSTGGSAASNGGTTSTGGSTASKGGTTSTGGSAVSKGGATSTAGTVNSGGGTNGVGGSKAAGGAAAGGAAAGGATAGGAAAGGATNGCSVSPVDPDATPQTKGLLCYLYSIYKKSVLSGQQETSWATDPAADVNYYNKLVSKFPAVLGGDFLYTNGTTARAQAWWNAGGITMLRYHMGAPPNSDTYDNSKLAFSSTQCTNVVTAGTSENTSLKSKLDYTAQQLQILQTANVPVILALYHETQANGWFWWSKCSGAQFIALYKYSYDYLVKTKGIHNIIRLMPFSGTPSAAYYPGAAFVDLGGPDEYSQPSQQPFASLYTTSAGIIGNTMPIPLHETGTIPQPASMFPSAAPWLLWNVWATYYSGAHDAGSGTAITFNTDANIQTAYASSYTITRDEVPNLK